MIELTKSARESEREHRTVSKSSIERPTSSQCSKVYRVLSDSDEPQLFLHSCRRNYVTKYICYLWAYHQKLESFEQLFAWRYDLAWCTFEQGDSKSSGKHRDLDCERDIPTSDASREKLWVTINVMEYIGHHLAAWHVIDFLAHSAAVQCNLCSLHRSSSTDESTDGYVISVHAESSAFLRLSGRHGSLARVGCQNLKRWSSVWCTPDLFQILRSSSRRCARFF